MSLGKLLKNFLNFQQFEPQVLINQVLIKRNKCIWSDSISIPHQNLNTSILQYLRTSIPIPIPIPAKLKTSIPIPIPIPLKTSIPQYLVLVLSMSGG